MTDGGDILSSKSRAVDARVTDKLHKETMSGGGDARRIVTQLTREGGQDSSTCTVSIVHSDVIVGRLSVEITEVEHNVGKGSNTPGHGNVSIVAITAKLARGFSESVSGVLRALGESAIIIVISSVHLVGHIFNVEAFTSRDTRVTNKSNVGLVASGSEGDGLSDLSRIGTHAVGSRSGTVKDLDDIVELFRINRGQSQSDGGTLSLLDQPVGVQTVGVTRASKFTTGLSEHLRGRGRASGDTNSNVLFGVVRHSETIIVDSIIGGKDNKRMVGASTNGLRNDVTGIVSKNSALIVSATQLSRVKPTCLTTV